MTTKRILIIALVIVALMPMTGVMLLRFSNVELSNVEHWVERYAEKNFGINLTLQNVKIGWGLKPEILIENIQLANAVWSTSQQPIFEAKSVLLQFSLLSLLGSRFEITDVEIDRPIIRVEQNNLTGEFNLPGQEKFSEGSKNSRGVDVGNIVLRNATIVFDTKKLTRDFSLSRLGIKSPGQTEAIEFSLDSVVNNVAVQIKGKSGSLSEIQNHREIAVDLAVEVANQSNQIQISGVVGNLLEWQGVNLWVKSNFSDTQAVASNWFPKAHSQLQFGNIITELEVVQPNALETLRVESFKSKMQVAGLDLTVDGEIGDLSQWQDIELSIEGNGVLQSPAVSRANWLPGEVEVALKGAVKGSIRDLRVYLDGRAQSGEKLNGQISGLMRWSDGAWSDGLDVVLNVPDEQSINARFPNWVDILFPLEAHSKLVYQTGQFDFKNVRVSSLNPSVDWEAKGEIKHIGSNLRGNFDFDGKLSKNALKQSDSRIYALFEKVVSTGQIDFTNAQLMLKNVSVYGLGDGVQFRASGGIQRNRVNHDADVSAIDFEVELDDTNVLGSLFSMPLPFIKSIVAGGSFTGNVIDGYEINDLKASSATAQGLHEAVGRIKIDHNQDRISGLVDYQSFVKSPLLLKDILPDPVEDLLGEQIYPFDAGATISFSFDGEKLSSIVARDIIVSSQNDVLEGVIKGNIFEGKPGNLDGMLRLKINARKPGEFHLVKESLGRISQIEGSALSLDSFISLQGNSVSMAVGSLEFQSDDSQLVASGSVSLTDPFQINDFKVDVSSSDIAELIDASAIVFKQGLPGTVQIVGVRDHSSETGVYNLTSKLVVGESDVSGNLKITSGDNENDAIEISGSMESRILDVYALLEKSEGSARLLSDAPIDISGLDKLIADVAIDVGHFRVRKVSVADVSLRLRHKDQKFQFDALSQSKYGDLQANLALKKNHNNYSAEMSLVIDDMDMQHHTNDAEIAEHGGIFDLQFELAGVGKSISEIAGRSDGQFVLHLVDRKFTGRKLNLLGQDLVESIVSSVNPFSSENRENIIECGVLKFDIINGLATSEQGMAMKTTDFTLLGGGNVNFKDESIRFVFSSKARKGLSINTNTFAKLVHVEGSLTEPKIKTSAKGILQTGAAIGAAIFSGGASLLAQGLYDKIKANSDVCSLAIAEKTTHHFR